MNSLYYPKNFNLASQCYLICSKLVALKSGLSPMPTGVIIKIVQADGIQR